VADGQVSATVEVPASKSLTNRYLVLGALASGASTIRDPLVSRDTRLMLGAVEALGARVERGVDDATWTVRPSSPLTGHTTVDCGLAGTVLRFVPPVAGLARGPVRFDGDERARSRPVAPLVDALRELGVDLRVDDHGRGTLPFTVDGHGSVAGGEVEVDASASSQFVSGLLLAGARYEQGLTVRHTGSMPSRPHVDMTVAVLRAASVAVTEPEHGTWRVEPGEVAPLDVRVEPDLSSAAPFLAIAAVTGGSVTVRRWPAATTQAGAAMPEILEAMGADVEVGLEGLTVRGPGRAGLSGVDLDLHAVGELTPVVAALAALAGSPSLLRGVAHLRGHETDRLAALERELGALGCGVTQTPDGLHIVPGALRATRWHTYHDHRMVMAGAVVALAVPGVQVLDAATSAKTFPGFVRRWEQVVAG